MKQGWFCESYLWIILIGQSDIVKVITFWSLPNVLFTQPNSCSEQVPHQDLSKPNKSGYSGNASKSSDSDESGMLTILVEMMSSKSFDPALGKVPGHASIFLILFLFIGWEVWIIVNLLLKTVSTLKRILVTSTGKYAQPRNLTFSGPKWKTRQHAILKKSTTGPGSCLLLLHPGADHLLLLYLAGALQLLLGSHVWLSSPASPDATHFWNWAALPCGWWCRFPLQQASWMVSYMPSRLWFQNSRKNSGHRIFLRVCLASACRTPTPIESSHFCC